MLAARIRPIVICLFRHNHRILVSEDFDSVKQDYFCRPLGGGIELGETSSEALQREIIEELGLEIENARLIGVLENIFVYEGQPGHEIVFVYDADFADKSVYEQVEIDGYEQEANAHFKAKWITLNEMQQRAVRLVPEKLVELLSI